MKTILFIFSLCCLSAINAQDKISSWSIELSNDSLLLGNRLKVTFLLKNARGKNFEAPDFKDFTIVMGPNHSSSMSIVNGDMTQEQSFTFLIEPKSEGVFYIEPAAISINGEIIETTPKEVIVFPNPDGIIQNEKEERPLNWQQLPWDPPKKKLEGKKKKKIYKI